MSFKKIDITIKPELLEQCNKIKPLDIIVGVLCKDVETTILNVLNVINEGLHSHFPDYKRAIVISEGKSIDKTSEVIKLFQPYSSIQKIYTKDLIKGGKGAGIRTILEIAHATDAKCIVLMDGDLLSIKPVWIQTIANPIIYGRADLTVPYYIRDKYDAVITNHLVYPFTRALYGLDIRQPIAGEFALSKNLSEILRKHPLFPLDFGIDIFIVTVAAAEKLKVKEGLYSLKIHESTTRYLEPEKLLVPMFKKVTGSMFELAKYYEKFWRNRKNNEKILYRNSFSKKPIPVKINIENLKKTYTDEYILIKSKIQKILPKDIFEELNNLNDNYAGFDSELWAEIVYNYAAAYKYANNMELKNLLINTLKTLWIGRFVSYALETKNMDTNEAEKVLQRQAEIFEQKLDYLRGIY
ncbi:MAG: glycosyl transferase family 2 [Candidatus Thermoplasmatota archaeon]|nr:glycosyl transferase family 2 [Candidatus Thermoplasmatota archaeon]